MAICQPQFAQAPAGRQYHAPSHCLGRHCHDIAFATVILRGAYLEAGDEGRHHVAPGDVLVHRAFESHLDCFSTHGADVLIIPMPSDARLAPRGRVADADALVRMAGRAPDEVFPALAAAFVAHDAGHDDWPDQLARALRVQPEIDIGQWATDMGLRPETVSRGFRQAYGSSPKAFRAQARARAAWEGIRGSSRPMGALAAELGFADQAHMSRAVTALTGDAPRTWRIAAAA